MARIPAGGGGGPVTGSTNFFVDEKLDVRGALINTTDTAVEISGADLLLEVDPSILTGSSKGIRWETVGDYDRRLTLSVSPLIGTKPTAGGSLLLSGSFKKNLSPFPAQVDYDLFRIGSFDDESFIIHDKWSSGSGAMIFSSSSGRIVFSSSLVGTFESPITILESGGTPAINFNTGSNDTIGQLYMGGNEVGLYGAGAGDMYISNNGLEYYSSDGVGVRTVYFEGEPKFQTDGEFVIEPSTVVSGNLDVNGSIRNSTGHLILSSSVGSIVAVSGNLKIGQGSNVAMLSASGDGNFILSNAAGTQGIKFDTTTTANRLYLYDESGNASDIQLGDAAFRPQASSYFNKNTVKFAGVNSSIYATGGYTLDITSTAFASAINGAAFSMVTGNQTNAGAYSSGDLVLATGTTNTTGSTGNINIYSGVAGAGQADAGDLILGVHGDPTGAGIEALRIKGADGLVYMGTAAQGIKFDTATTDGRLRITDESGGTPVIEIGTGANYDTWTRGTFTFSSNPGTITQGSATWALNIAGKNNGTAANSAAVSVYTGTQVFAGDYDSGHLNLYTGLTTTDGNSGNVNIYTGAAAAGAADAGDINFLTHGTIQGLQVKGADGLVYMGTVAQGVKFDTSVNAALTLTDEIGNDLTLSIGEMNIQKATADIMHTGGTLFRIGTTPEAGSGGSSATAPLLLYTGNQTGAGTTTSGYLSIYTGDTTQVGGITGDVNIYTGAAFLGAADAGNILFSVNGNDAADLAMTIKGADGLVYMGTAAQGIKFDTSTNANRLRITDEGGNAADIQLNAGAFRPTSSTYFNAASTVFYAVTATVVNNHAAGLLRINTLAHASAGSATGNIQVSTGNQTGVPNQASGDLNLYTGTTNTTGSTGDVNIYSGLAGAGSADAGDINFLTHGTIQGLQVKGADGLVYMGTAAQGIKFDTSTTNGRLIITEEDGTAADIQLVNGAFRPNPSSWFTKALLTFAESAGATVNNGGATGYLQLRTADVGSSTSGPIYIKTGAGTGTGNSGPISVYTETSAAGTVGDVRLGVGGDTANLLIEGLTGNTIISATQVTISGNLKVTGDIIEGAAQAGTSVDTEGVVVDTFENTEYRTVKYVVSVSSGSSWFQSEEILLMHSGTTSQMTEYSILSLPGISFIGFETSMTGSTVNLLASGSKAENTVKLVRTTIDI